MNKPLTALTTLTLLALGAYIPEVKACGGLFCSQTNPVNQVAERIIFAQNPDSTVTAVIEIKYAGPAEKFAWVLPLPGTPEIGVSSVAALDRLQAQTNPQYNLTTRFEGNCAQPAFASANDSDLSAPRANEGAGGVVVQASGSVGPYDYTVISVAPGSAEPETVAVEWLGMNGYDVTALAPELLRSYLASGMNLTAFRLTKGNNSGSIRPIMLTYPSALPMIPIRPTALAAADDMGILVWVLGTSPAIAKNYRSLELNEALINWFNASSNYNAVVTAAANEAGGQGFVTEFADRTTNFSETIVGSFEIAQWERVSTETYASPRELFVQAAYAFGSWDGFTEVVRTMITPPLGMSVEELVQCPDCQNEALEFDSAEFLTALHENVVKPMLDTQALLKAHDYISRLYTTMSADEMSVDPLFDFNPDLKAVSNIHTAERVVYCDDSNGTNGPWSVVLPQGTPVTGEEGGVWPVTLDSKTQPAAFRILQQQTSGQPTVVSDNSKPVSDDLSNNAVDMGFVVDDSGKVPVVTRPNSDGGCTVGKLHVAPSDKGGLVLALSALLLAFNRRKRQA